MKPKKTLSNLGRVLSLIMLFVLIWFSLVFYILGKKLYGTDATILWASGIMIIVAIYSLPVIFDFKKDERGSKNGH